MSSYSLFIEILGALLPKIACGPALRLTASEARLSGAAWYRRKVNVREGFDTTFKFQISNPSLKCNILDDVNTLCRSRGADGIGQNSFHSCTCRFILYRLIRVFV